MKETEVEKEVTEEGRRIEKKQQSWNAFLISHSSESFPTLTHLTFTISLDFPPSIVQLLSHFKDDKLEERGVIGPTGCTWLEYLYTKKAV